ncbi:hypothetical protein IC620_15265 [Hazenella sp. IB182357]|uniref:Uncharacterized protein n=1 Tax=Polycladospora coralii TaxID=2771432 RepID=A0A926NHL3_9BACL|nr:hypothetical protein [Polycladospora coralii]MBD1373704.1 hypothetical protein [Polycladospora coralii]
MSLANILRAIAFSGGNQIEQLAIQREIPLPFQVQKVRMFNINGIVK